MIADNWSGLFVDTAARRDKTDQFMLVRKSGVVGLLAASSFLFLSVLAGDDASFEFAHASPRAQLTAGLVMAFVFKTVLRILTLTNRRITLIEIALESAILQPLAFLMFASLTRRSDASGMPTLLFELVVYPALFAFAVYVQVRAEFERAAFKTDPRNRERLFTNSYFQKCRHINMTAEILQIGVIGASTGSLLGLIVPTLVALRIVLLSIPELEYYLAITYPRDWPFYARKTPAVLIPYTL